MSHLPERRYHIRNGEGELVVSSYAELRMLYSRQFIDDEDEVRREGSDTWVKAKELPDLRLIRPRRWHGWEFPILALAICTITLVIALVVYLSR